MTASPVLIHLVDRSLPLAITPAVAGELLGLSDTTVRRQCEEGSLPTLPRRNGGVWRIPTARLLDQLGIPYEVGAA